VGTREACRAVRPERSLSRTILTTVAALLILLLSPGRVQAQLVSPGKLIKSHSALEGIRSCTKCHQLGERGVANEKCLDCHRELADRIARKAGFHATIGAKSCGECHKDHFGPDFDAVHFDTAGFHHADVGYDIVGGHLKAACRDCHQPDNITDAAVKRTMAEHGRLASTYLGLGTTCVGCHRKDDPHEGQFGARACEDCHSEGDWKKPDRFDHAKTRYPLRGRHREIQCRECHTPIPGKKGALQLTGLEFATCSACHQKDDPHAGQFQGRRCEECHTELDWKKAERFDHAATRYPLTGRHRDVACEKCHTPMPGPTHPLRLRGLEFGTCAACHTKDDPHNGRLGTKCADCHTTDGWRGRGGSAFESSFDHAKTRFALKGKHATLQCAACHSPANAHADGIALSFVADTRDRRYPVPASEHCTSCHVDYHRGTFAQSPGGSECASCHVEDDWVPTSYDITRHNRDARYKLAALGQSTLQFRIANQECVACHATKDPHGQQFAGRACNDCHDTRSFKIPAFDHARTRYPLDGAHRKVPCASCHPLVTGPDGRSTRRYRPLGTTCKDCHEEGSK
jgi:hypothetical protein